MICGHSLSKRLRTFSDAIAIMRPLPDTLAPTSADMTYSCQMPAAFTPANFPDYPRALSLNPYCQRNAQQSFVECKAMCNTNPRCTWYCENKYAFDSAGCSPSATGGVCTACANP